MNRTIYVPRSPATFDLTLTPSVLKMRHAKWISIRTSPLQLAFMSNLIELACLQRVIGEQLTNRGEGTYLDVYGSIEPTYQNSSLSWSHMYQGMNTKESLSWTDQRDWTSSDQSCKAYHWVPTLLIEERLNSTTLHSWLALMLIELLN